MNTIRVLMIDGCKAPPSEGATIGSEQLRVTRKPTLADGLAALQESPFQLVLLDLSLLDDSASESVTKILKMAAELPVIAFASDSETARAVQGFHGGTQQPALSECQSDSLIRTIQYAMERKEFIVDREADLRELTKDRKELIAHLSHELRNALTCIFQFGNILTGGLAGELSEDQHNYLGIMMENASRIRILLNRLTEIAHASPAECANKHEPLFSKVD